MIVQTVLLLVDGLALTQGKDLVPSTLVLLTIEVLLGRNACETRNRAWVYR